MWDREAEFDVELRPPNGQRIVGVVAADFSLDDDSAADAMAERLFMTGGAGDEVVHKTTWNQR